MKIKKLYFTLFIFLFASFALSQVFIPLAFWRGSQPLTISPTSVVIGINLTQTFVAAGGFGVKTFSLVSGTGSINSSTGVYTAPSAAGSAVVRVTDGQGSTADAAVTIVAVTGITVSQSVITGGLNQVFAVTAQALLSPSGSSDITAIATWVTSDPSVATVTNGVITFVGVGTATITVSYAGYSQNIYVTVANKTLTGLTVTPASFSMPVYGTKSYTAVATYSDASSADVTASVTWSSSNTGLATVSNTAPNIGKATGVAQGSLTITATMGAVTGSSALTINNATLTSIAITPYDVLVTTGVQVQLVATGTFSDASTYDVSESATWASSNTSAATVSTTAGSKGLVTTPTFTGYRTTNITATIGAVVGTTPFGVNGATITAIIVKPTVTITVGSTYPLQAWANLSDGGTVEVTKYATWTTATPANVTVSNGAGTQGVVTGVATGTSNITATYSGIAGSRIVTVGASSSTTDIGIGLNADYYNWTGGSPPSPFIAANKKGTRIDAKVDFSWGTGSAPMGVSDLFAVRWTGFYEAVSATNYFCTYTDDGVRLWINGVLVINNWTDHSGTWDCTSNITLTPGVKYSIQMDFFENGGDAEAHLTRSSTSAAAAQSLANAVPQVNLYPYGTLITNALTVSQSVISGGINQKYAITAQALQSDGNIIDVTTTGVWATANASIATVSNGVITFVAAGSTTVTVTYGGLTQTIYVTVLNKTLSSIAVTPASSSMAVYATKAYTATATYSDSSTSDVTSSVTWSSSNTGRATISNTAPNIGVATGVAAGSLTVTATMGAVSGNTTLTITSATLSSIAITPYDYLAASSQAYQLKATGTFSDATTADVTGSATWSSSSTSVATVSNTTGTKGLVATQAVGSYQQITMTATIGAVSGTSPFGVNSTSILSILVKPSVTITVGSTYALQAWAIFADGGSVEVTEYATWTSASTANVTVSNGTGTRGKVTGVATGSSTITASYSGISGTRTVTVGASASVTDIGNGLNADYYTWTGGSPPSPFITANRKGSRIDANVDFGWGGGAAAMGAYDNFAVRWTGYYKATSTTNYFCTYSDDGVRLWINGTQVVNNWTDHGGTWDCTGNIAMTVGTKYSITMEFYESGGGAEAHLTRSSTSAAAAQNLTNAIPQAELYSY